MTGETVMLDRWPPLLTSGTVRVMLCPGEVTGEELTAPSAKPPISSTPMLLTTTGEFAVTDDCYVLGQCEGHVLGDVSAVGCVFSPYGGIDREVHGVDTLLGKFGDTELVPYFCGAVVGHVIEMSGVAGINDVKGPGSGCRALAGAASGACSGAGTGGSAAAGNIRLDGDIPEGIIFTR